MKKIASMSEEEVDGLVDMIDYDTPLWGSLLATGDETPAYPYVFCGIGILALIALALTARRRRTW